MLTAIILNWMREGNLRTHILPALLGSSLIEQVLIVNNNNAVACTLAGPKVVVMNLSEDLGLTTRFAAACMAQTDGILIQDDDLVIAQPELDSLYGRWKSDPEVLHGIHGRRPRPGNTYSISMMGDHECPIVLTRMMIMHQKYAGTFFQEVGAFRKLLCNAKPSGNGEDIVMSYVVQKNSGRLNRIHGIKTKELRAEHSIHHRPGHYNHRTTVLRACQVWLDSQTKGRSDA